MGTDRRDDRHGRRRLRLITQDTGREDTRATTPECDVVFDFEGVHHPGFADLSLILTARLQAAPQDRVWVRAIPHHTWMILRGLGLDHLFRHYPGPAAEPN